MDDSDRAIDPAGPQPSKGEPPEQRDAREAGSRGRSGARERPEPWNVPGRYGWVGGTGTAGYVVPSAGRVTVWLGQVEMQGPDDFDALAAFLTWAAGR